MQLRITSRKKFIVLLYALGLIPIVVIYPRQTANFFYSIVIQIKDYVHFYDYRPVESFATRTLASYTIHGIDVSCWQERIDWQRVAKTCDDGIHLQFASTKATEGEKLMGPYFSHNQQLSRENDLPRGAYHYFSPSVSASVQARLFLQTVDFSRGDFPAVLDVEEREKLSAKELHKQISRWLKMVEKRTGKEPIIYPRAVFRHTNLADYFNEYSWRMARHYQRHPDNDGMVRHFQQHPNRGQVNGINGPVNFNVLNGTMEGLQAFVDGIKETP